MPSVHHERLTFKLDLHRIKERYPLWTHVILRTLPTSKPVFENILIFYLNLLIDQNVLAPTKR